MSSQDGPNEAPLPEAQLELPAPAEPVAGGAVGAPAETVAEENAALFERFMAKSKKYFRCLTCKGEPIKERTHFYGGTGRHEKKGLSEEDRVEWATRQVAAEKGGAEIRLAQVREAIAHSHAAAAREAGEEEARAQPWRIDFGAHSKPKAKTLQEIMRVDPMYFAALIQQTPRGFEPLANKPTLKQMLIEEGLWERCVADAIKLRAGKESKTKSIEASGEAQSMHPQVRELHDMNLAVIQEAEGNPAETFIAVVQASTRSERKSKRQRATATRASKFLKNCLLCGHHGHVTSSCSKRTDEEYLAVEERRLQETEDLSRIEKRRRKLIAHLKYTNIEQRTAAYEARNRHAARVPVMRSFSELDRATPSELVCMHLKDGLLMSLEGLPCPVEACAEEKTTGCSQDSVLGQLRTTSKAMYATVTRRSVWYACLKCRRPVPVNRGSAIFPVAIGGYGVTQNTLCYWNCVHGATQTFTALQLGLSEDFVATSYRHCRRICAQEALRMQSQIKFGGRGSKTTDIEWDEHCFREWRVGNMYYFFAFIGFYERGAPEKFWLGPMISTDEAMPPGVLHSTDEARVPPISKKCVEGYLDVVFTADTNAIGMTDSAREYQVLQELLTNRFIIFIVV